MVEEGADWCGPRSLCSEEVIGRGFRMGAKIYDLESTHIRENTEETHGG